MKLKKLARLGPVICTLFTLVNSAFSQATSITYQGTLMDTGNSANGVYDLRFSLYDSVSGGVQIGSTVDRTLPITNGLFSTEIDFGFNFAGADRWMQLEVRTNGIGASFIVLSSRQRITAAPYATYALATATASNVVSGKVVSSVNALKDDVLLQAGNNVSITPERKHPDDRGGERGRKQHLVTTRHQCVLQYRPSRHRHVRATDPARSEWRPAELAHRCRRAICSIGRRGSGFNPDDRAVRGVSRENVGDPKPQR
jgi:hypothetical protein